MQIVDSVRNESEHTAISSLEEEHFFHHQELANLTEKQKEMAAETSSLNKQLEAAERDAFARKAQLDNNVSQTSTAFATQFSTVDDALAFVIARPHFEAQTTAELEKVKAKETKYKRKLKSQAVALR